MHDTVIQQTLRQIVMCTFLSLAACGTGYDAVNHPKLWSSVFYHSPPGPGYPKLLFGKASAPQLITTSVPGIAGSAFRIAKILERSIEGAIVSGKAVFCELVRAWYPRLCEKFSVLNCTYNRFISRSRKSLFVRTIFLLLGLELIVDSLL